MQIDAPGIYEMPARDYHRDPCPEPSLSASIAHMLLSQSPRHAYHAHPKLNPAWEEPEPTREQDEGATLHSLILENTSVVAPLPFNDYKTAAARDARDAAWENGKIPILARRWEELQPIAEAVREQLDQHLDASDALTAGLPERVLVWREETPFGPIWCRSRVDWIQHAVDGWLDDLKTVARTAEPGEWGRHLLPEGRALQQAFYLRGARALGRRPRGFRFIVVEREAPFGLSVVTCDPEMAATAERQVAAAIDIFARCLYSGQWPGYFPRTHYVEPKPWQLADWEARETALDEFRRVAVRKVAGNAMA